MSQPSTPGHQVNFGKSLVGLVKQGFWEIPSVMCATIMGLVGLGMGIYSVDKYMKNNSENTEYKRLYIVMRPEDPRVERLKNPVYTKY